MITWLERVKLTLKYKALPFLKKYWFLIFLPLMMTCSYNLVDSNFGPEEAKKCEVESDRPDCYTFYGIAQNDLKVSKRSAFLKVNYLIEGWPAVEHDVFVEIIDHHGKVDFLYSEKHTSNHKAHYHSKKGQRIYKAYYNIPHSKLGPGKYYLRVTFRFHLPLKTVSMVSNDIGFKIAP